MDNLYRKSFNNGTINFACIQNKTFCKVIKFKCCQQTLDHRVSALD